MNGKVTIGKAMARIRKVEIRNFRSVRSLDWFPSSGINCLIGSGDTRLL
jgi:predicted ATP-dependent endonuclease of OLD family